VEPAPGWRVARLGFAGETATNIAPVALPIVRDLRPTLTLVQAGGNDATGAVFLSGERRATATRATAEAVLSVAEAAREAGGRAIVLTPAPPIGLELWKTLLTGGALDARFVEVADAQASLTAERGHTVWDGDRLFRDADGRLDDRNRADGVHWTPAAYRMLNARLAPELESACPADQAGTRP
jgi:lysophospholipase L1-like esterase